MSITAPVLKTVYGLVGTANPTDLIFVILSGAKKLVLSLFRLLKKLQMQGVKEREMRRTLLYASIMSDADNDADGAFSAA
jgi:hypothetical protein